MEWIKTTDRLPAPYEPVLLVHHKHRGNGYDVDAGIYMGDGKWRTNGSYPISVKYWMPYPEPPEDVAP